MGGISGVWLVAFGGSSRILFFLRLSHTNYHLVSDSNVYLINYVLALCFLGESLQNLEVSRPVVFGCV